MPDRSLIYIPDGNPRSCESLAAVLEVHGYSASICDSAHTFRAQSSTDKPACMLLNLWLSDKFGLTFFATEFFKSLGLPVIVTGPLPHSSDVFQAFRLGVRTRAELIQIQTQLQQIPFDDCAGMQSFSETPEHSLSCIENVGDITPGFGR